MSEDWQELTALTTGKPIVVERVRRIDSDTIIEGEFELPSKARLSADEQFFLIAFARSYGSIDMTNIVLK